MIQCDPSPQNETPGAVPWLPFRCFSASLQDMTTGIMRTHLLHFTSPFLFKPCTVRFLSSMKRLRALRLAQSNGRPTYQLLTALITVSLKHFLFFASRSPNASVVPPTSVSVHFSLPVRLLTSRASLGPDLFLSFSCTSSCDFTVISHGFKCHLYANNSHIYISSPGFSPGSRFIYPAASFNIFT